MKDLNLYSTPWTVYQNARNLYGYDVDIKPSTIKDKKYMIYDKDNDKWVHFGQYGYEDYTKHKDEKRRNNFLSRNHKWLKRDKYSPAFLSYNLLW